MIEDQLSRDERIRLECLAQAVASNMGRGVSSEGVILTASRYERWVREGKT